MRRTLTVAAIAVVILAGVVKVVGLPSKSAAGDTAIHPTISPTDLQTATPHYLLPVEEAPQP